MNITDLQQIDSIFKKRLESFATKRDLDHFATKKDLESFATKRDLKRELAQYATKDDLKQQLAEFSTKKDLKDGLDDLLGDIISAVEKAKADKTEVQSLEKRVNLIEDELAITPPINR